MTLLLAFMRSIGLRRRLTSSGMTLLLALGCVATGCRDQAADSPPTKSGPAEPAASPTPTSQELTGKSPETGRPEEKTEVRTGRLPHRVMPEPAGLHNLFAVSSQVFSGSEPDGAEGFDSLVELGVRTIVSVDGARPQVDLARERGIRYVHIPIGYDGVPVSAQRALARVMRDNLGPVYIHCHHGKHRGPAAAAVACLAARQLDAETSVSLLREAGTSPDYAGLYRDVRQFEPPGPTDELPELMEVVAVDSLVTAMADLGRHFDDLKLCRQAQWQTPAGHPDLVPVGVARLVQEGLHETVRTADLTDYPVEFRTLLEQADKTAEMLAQALRAKDTAGAETAFRDVEKSCKECHTRWRDQ